MEKNWKMVNDKHVWEGWWVSDFIRELEETFPYQDLKTKDDVRKWCKRAQPYYKKHIPQVANHFINKLNLSK